MIVQSKNLQGKPILTAFLHTQMAAFHNFQTFSRTEEADRKSAKYNIRMHNAKMTSALS